MESGSINIVEVITGNQKDYRRETEAQSFYFDNYTAGVIINIKFSAASRRLRGEKFPLWWYSLKLGWFFICLIFEVIIVRNIILFAALSSFFSSAYAIDFQQLNESVDKQKAMESVDREKATEALKEQDIKKGYEAVDTETAKDSVDSEKAIDALMK